MRGMRKGKGEMGAKYSSQEAKGTKGVVPKMSGLHREEPLREGQLSPWAGKFRIEGRVCQVGSEGCWENLEARSALVCWVFQGSVMIGTFL